MTTLLRTPLFVEYQRYGAKTIDFGGWELPVQFTSIKEEHVAVREHAGLFDVSHMGEVEVKGSGSIAFLQYLLTNDVSTLQDGQAQYTAMCYEDGGTVDDLLVYRKGEEDYLLVVNASNIEKDYEWITKHAFGDVTTKNISESVAQLAIQGPRAVEITQLLCEDDISMIRPFTFKDNFQLADYKVLLSRTGYTGEDGFEIYCAVEDVVGIWNKLLEVGAEKGLVPCGLGARDTLRLEATLSLYGQELTNDISPLEAKIGFAVKLNKEADFIGKEALIKQKENLSRRVVGIEIKDRGIPRHGYEIFDGEKRIGEVTSGTQIPSTKRNIALALVDIAYIAIGTEVDVLIRNKKWKAEVVATPFYKRK